MVLRDHNGMIIFSAWVLYCFVKSAAIGEALACPEGLKMALTCSSGNPILEIHCTSILDSFETPKLDTFEVVLIVKEFYLIEPSDRQVIMNKLSRRRNVVDQELYQLGCRGL
jgi:hypothetical protein